MPVFLAKNVERDPDRHRYHDAGPILSAVMCARSATRTANLRTGSALARARVASDKVGGC